MANILGTWPRGSVSGTLQWTGPKSRMPLVPDVRFAVTGPRAWDNSAVVYRMLQKVGAKYGVGRLCMLTGDGAGLSRVALEQAKRSGIHSAVVVPTLHGVYGRMADALAWRVVLDLQPKFVIAFYWDLKDGGSHRNVRDAMILTKRADIPIVRVKVAERVGMMAADEYYKMQEKKKNKKRKAKDRGKPKG